MRSINFFNAALWVAGAVSTPTIVDAQGQNTASNDEWFMQALGSTGADGRQLVQNAFEWFGVFARSSVRTSSDNGFPGNAGFTSFVTSVNRGGNPFTNAGIGSRGSSPADAYDNTYCTSVGLGYARFFQSIAGSVTTSVFAGQKAYGDRDERSIFVNNGNGVVYKTPVGGVAREPFSKGDHDLTGIAHVTATPEPASLALMATGLFGLIPLIRRRRREH